MGHPPATNAPNLTNFAPGVTLFAVGQRGTRVATGAQISPGGRRVRRAPLGVVCQPVKVTSSEPTREELLRVIERLRREVERLKDEIQRIRRDSNEVPPHYL